MAVDAGLKYQKSGNALFVWWTGGGAAGGTFDGLRSAEQTALTPYSLH